MSYFAICTPTYNRAGLLRRPFDSLMKQTFRDFVWVIVDDGSSDDTEALVKEFEKEASFPIVYVKKENGGRASALNLSYQYIASKYVINLDSDDALLPEALQAFYEAWESIPAEEYDRFWCVTAHCIDNQTGERIGPLWPKDINTLTGKKQYRKLLRYKGGEKCSCRKVDLLRQHPFPQYAETKFVPEDVVWERINGKYDQYCINAVARLYYTDTADSLVKSGYKMSTQHSAYYAAQFFINECFERIWYHEKVRFAVTDIIKRAYITKRSHATVMQSINAPYKRVILTVLWPFVWAASKLYYRNKQFI